MRGIFLFFIIVPIAEMMLLFKVGDYIGAIPTVSLVVLTAAIGVQVLKVQGFSTLTRANKKLSNGELPGQEMIEGIFLAVGGAFLLTPGFITDAFGFIFLVGPTRRLIVKALINSGKFSMPGSDNGTTSSGRGGASFTSFSFGVRSSKGQQEPTKPGQFDEQHDVFEGEFEKETPVESRLDGSDKPKIKK